jgi:hypothetical protein
MGSPTRHPESIRHWRYSPSTKQLACDTILRASLHQPKEVLQALATSTTLGSFAQQLNRARSLNNVLSPYVVFGDPETAVDYSTDLATFPGSPFETGKPMYGGPGLSDYTVATASSYQEPPPQMEIVEDLATSFEAVRLAELLWVFASTGDRLRLLAASQFLTALQRIRERGWWPHQLWSERESDVIATQERCPVCDSARGILRRYLAGPGMVRHSLECPRCRIVRDQSANSTSVDLAVRAPECLTAGQAAIALVHVANLSQTETFVGGVTMAVDGPDSNVRIAPSQVALQLGPLEQREIRFDIWSPEPTEIAHFFSLKVVAVLSGAVLWRARPITVCR